MDEPISAPPPATPAARGGVVSVNWIRVSDVLSDAEFEALICTAAATDAYFRKPHFFRHLMGLYELRGARMAMKRKNLRKLLRWAGWDVDLVALVGEPVSMLPGEGER